MFSGGGRGKGKGLKYDWGVLEGAGVGGRNGDCDGGQGGARREGGGALSPGGDWG